MKKYLLIITLVLFGTITSTTVVAQVANQPPNLFICDDNNDGFVIFDLTVTEPYIIGGQDPTNLFVKFYVSQADANVDINPIAFPESYINSIVNFQIIYARLEDTTNGDYDTTNFAIEVEESPIIIVPTPLVTCDDTEIFGPDDELEPFDLESKIDEITGGDANISITYHESQSDADTGDNPLVSPYINLFNPQAIYIRAENITGCVISEGFTLDLIVNPLPSPITPTPLNVCDEDNDGFAMFTLTDKDLEIIGGEPGVSLSYHETQIDAELGIGALTDPYVNIQTPIHTIFARVENFVTGCFAIVELDLIVQPTPEINLVDDLILVDEDGNGIEIFDLTVRASQILNGQVATITYHETEADAATNINAIANATSYINITNPQTIYYRLENADSCYSVGSFTLILVDALIDEEPDDIFIDEGDGDGLAIFDLTINEAQMLGDQNPAIALFTYHTTFEDSDNGVNAIASPTAYQNVLNPQTIYVRLTNNNTGFYVLTSFEIETDEILGIEDDFISNFKMYPNPSEAIINLMSNSFSETVGISIYNLQGQLVITEEKTPSNETIQVDISNLTTGIYFVKIVSGENTVIKRVIKQ
ncbi:MAG: T9SS type A sorting domain-containing protein [Flavobacteriaceae bacterium]|nr:T9SS type A sorting domain-containing protein [Flavobacteriaceae bacterium]